MRWLMIIHNIGCSGGLYQPWMYSSTSFQLVISAEKRWFVNLARIFVDETQMFSRSLRAKRRNLIKRQYVELSRRDAELAED